jgi:RNA polymerase sigma-70 factor (ECF subfamily)
LRIIGKGRRRQSVPTFTLEEGQDLDNVVPVCTTKSSYTKSEILTAIDSLPQEQRSVVLLAAVEGFTCKEISAMLEVPMGTVMSRLSRGRAEVRKWLVPCAVTRPMNSEPAG